MIDYGVPSSRNNILSHTSKLSTTSNSSRVTNKRVSYSSNNGTMFFEESAASNNDGELDVDKKNSVYVGRHTIRNGDRKQTYRRVPDPMIEVYHKNANYFNELGINLDNGIIADGCFKTNKQTLQRTMIPESNSEYAGYPSMSLIRKMKSSIKSTIRKLDICQLAKVEECDLHFSSFNMKTYPGFYYSEYCNHKTKRDAVSIACKIATEKWKYINDCSVNGTKLKRSKLFPGTYAIGARNKRDFPEGKFEELTSRAVHMPEFHNEIHSASWTDPISNLIRDRASGPIYIGNSFIDYQRMHSDMFNCESIIEGDVKRFDSRVYITFIIIAVAISRLFYDHDDVEIDNHFVAIFDSVAIKDYYTPGGYIYRMIHGLPSGVKSTTLYGSIINLVLQTEFNSNINSKRLNFCIGGDDFLIGYKDKIDSSQLTAVAEKAHKFGWELKYLSIKSFSSKNIEDRPYFYKYTIDDNEPVISTTTVIERAFAPWNKKYKNFSDIFNFLIDLLPSFGAPRSNFIVYYHLLSYVKFRHLRIHSPPSYFFELHRDVYNKVMAGKIFPKSSSRVPRVTVSLLFNNQEAEGFNVQSIFNGRRKDIKVNFVLP